MHEDLNQGFSGKNVKNKKNDNGNLHESTNILVDKYWSMPIMPRGKEANAMN